jgi:hypothetical protein
MRDIEFSIGLLVILGVYFYTNIVVAVVVGFLLVGASLGARLS